MWFESGKNEISRALERARCAQCYTPPRLKSLLQASIESVQLTVRWPDSKSNPGAAAGRVRAGDQTAQEVNWSPSRDSSALFLMGQPIKSWIFEQRWGKKKNPFSGPFSHHSCSLAGDASWTRTTKENILRRVKLVIIRGWGHHKYISLVIHPIRSQLVTESNNLSSLRKSGKNVIKIPEDKTNKSLK